MYVIMLMFTSRKCIDVSQIMLDKMLIQPVGMKLYCWNNVVIVEKALYDTVVDNLVKSQSPWSGSGVKCRVI